MASVRFICGTQSAHKELEARLADFLGMDDAILYSSCFDANGGLFETLLDEQDAVISDALNHASIIDGIRLCKARRLRYANDDLDELETRLKEASDARVRLIATDGVFSMDGVIARLDRICDLADRYDALVMVDDSHATGFVGRGGRGTPEHRGVLGRVDIVTSTLGKALGGAAGGFTAARGPIVEWLRQRSRPYLFSNSIPPVIAAATLRVLDLVQDGEDLRARLAANTQYFRRRMTEAGFDVVPGEHPIVPVMLGDAALAGRFAERLLDHGVYVIGFSFPVVPMGKARIRTQMCAGHDREQLDRAIDAFVGHRSRARRHESTGGEELMKALVKAERAPGIWLQDIPEPGLGANDVRIRVRKTAICGTDMHIYSWDAWAQKTIPVPMAVGHEYSGEIVEIGSEVQGLAVGDRVSGEGHITCGYCRNCRAGRRHLCRNTVGVGVNRPGCFAEYLVIPAFNAFKLPDSISDEVASLLDPLGNATHTALAFDLVGRGHPDHGRGPDRDHGGSDRALRWRTPRRDHRRERLPARSRAEDGCDAAPSTSRVNRSTTR